MIEAKTGFRISSLYVYLIGLVCSLISMFLPWYSYQINSELTQFEYLYFPMNNWTEHIADLPDLSILIPFYFFELFYIAIISSILLIRFTLKIKSAQKENYLAYLIYFTPILAGFIFLYFIFLIVINGFFVPHMQVQFLSESINFTKVFSLSSGTILRFFSIIFLGYSSVTLKKLSLEDFEDEYSDNSSTEGKIFMTPIEESFQIEEELFLDTKNNLIFKDNGDDT